MTLYGEINSVVMYERIKKNIYCGYVCVYGEIITVVFLELYIEKY